MSKDVLPAGTLPISLAQSITDDGIQGPVAQAMLGLIGVKDMQIFKVTPDNLGNITFPRPFESAPDFVFSPPDNALHPNGTANKGWRAKMFCARSHGATTATGCVLDCVMFERKVDDNYPPNPPTPFNPSLILPQPDPNDNQSSRIYLAPAGNLKPIPIIIVAILLK